MPFSHDITFCMGENINCPRKDTCYRYKEIERIPIGKVYSIATLYNVACNEKNNYQLYIKDKENTSED